MTKVTVSPYGTWKSPLTPQKLAENSSRPAGLITAEKHLYMLETRPADNGRTVLINLNKPDSEPVTPSPFNIRSKVHEYGGTAITYGHDRFYFSEFSDGRIYQQKPGGKPVPLTAIAPVRFADFVYDKKRNMLYSVMESHQSSDLEPDNCLVTIDCNNGKVTQIASGYDFYASPRLSPDGSCLAYVRWQHPQMPWDGTELVLANLDGDGHILETAVVAGSKAESVVQPQWAENSRLIFISDRTDWYNLYQYCDGKISPIHPKEADFSGPMWQLGMRSYSLLNHNRAFCTFCENGLWKAGFLDLDTHNLTPIDTEFCSFSALTVVGKKIFFIGATPDQPPVVAELNSESGKIKIIHRPTPAPLPEAYISKPESINFPTGNGLTAHAFFYAPCNPDYRAPDGELPPLLTISHGGPTGAADNRLSAAIQFWTSRGFAVVDVNYGGSANFGRKYRERLYGNWGIVDVKDCCVAAKYLADQEKVDPERLAIRGGSAGGLTTLCALTFENMFKAGASYFGVSNLEALAKTTHKFESKYMEKLVGPYPDALAIYRERSPVNHADKLSCPVIFFQGALDRVVPKEQPLETYNKLLEKGIPTAYVEYPEEAHGFMLSQNISHSIETELYFYSRIFDFVPHGKIKGVKIYNLD